MLPCVLMSGVRNPINNLGDERKMSRYLWWYCSVVVEWCQVMACCRIIADILFCVEIMSLCFTCACVLVSYILAFIL